MTTVAAVWGLMAVAFGCGWWLHHRLSQARVEELVEQEMHALHHYVRLDDDVYARLRGRYPLMTPVERDAIITQLVELELAVVDGAFDYYRRPELRAVKGGQNG